jgi:hypothetical protein
VQSVSRQDVRATRPTSPSVYVATTHAGRPLAQVRIFSAEQAAKVRVDSSFRASDLLYSGALPPDNNSSEASCCMPRLGEASQGKKKRRANSLVELKKV